jgi:hypothetical protein
MDTNTPQTSTSEPHDFGQPILEWEGRITPEHDRGKRWYVVSSIAVVVITAGAIIVGAWSLALVTLLCAGLYVLTHDHSPAPRRLSVFEHGLVFDGSYHTWNEFASFWFVKTRHYAELHLERADGRLPTIVQTGDVHPDRIKQVFAGYIPYDPEKTENIFDTISRICKL